MHYYYKWKESQLAEAVLELRRFALPGIEHADRERFYVWPPTDPSRVVEVRLDTSNVEWLQTGSYGKHLIVGDEPSGVPPDEPIWLPLIDPSIVWTRVVPAVLTHRGVEYPGPNDPPVLDITDWALSDHAPTELVHTRPTYELHDSPREPGWTW